MTSELSEAFETVYADLLALRAPEGHWEGELSSSALSTAVAISALGHAGVAGDPNNGNDRKLISAGLEWLAANQNEDGGFGDSIRSKSNLSTTILCLCAWRLTKNESKYPEHVGKCLDWVKNRAGSSSAEWAQSVRDYYGTDRTFSVPILTTCALAGLVSWQEVPRLPHELSVLPQSWYRFVSLPVVSYALPALISMGICIHRNRSSVNPWSGVRSLAIRPALRVLARLQPHNGGFLEATPLTAFVALSLAGAGERSHAVVAKGLAFLRASARADGSWPIDTHLATWVTSLAVKALDDAGKLEDLPGSEQLARYLLDQQHQVRHPFTGAEPGGWAWSPLPGGVPDADDTPGALLALKALGARRTVGKGKWDWLEKGIEWLGGLQNRDGGMPTFCRGWGKLPFDRSGTDLTAHAMRAVAPYMEGASGLASHGLEKVKLEIRLLVEGGLEYLAGQQRPDGSWLPLWFGHQDAEGDINPVFGTSRVLLAYRDLGLGELMEARKGAAYLFMAQNEDGSWGGAQGVEGQVEETALALTALMDLTPAKQPKELEKLRRGLGWLCRAIRDQRHRIASPIGFYFARLWYFESLYPIIFSVSALGRALRHPGLNHRNY